MRAYGLTLAAFFLVALPLGAQAKTLGNNDRYMCSWGSDIAAGAQPVSYTHLTLPTIYSV